MANQLDISTAPGWLQRMWAQRQYVTVVPDSTCTLSVPLGGWLDDMDGYFDDGDPWPEVPPWE